MGALYKQEGAMMEVEILKDKEVLDFIDTHAAVLDSTFEKVKMSDTMRSSLQQSNWVFSGMKTFHELKEAFPSLIDENGEKKPFERFYNDVQRVDETYNRNYLRAEYNFVSTSAEMAARWEEFEKDGDRYFLQYRTVGDDRVRQEHAALEGTTLPVEHPFWDTHYPPNGWNCRCNVVQVRKSRYPATSEDELIDRKKALAEEQARHKGKSEMFRFNPGKQKKTFPDYNPYTIKRCCDCDLAKCKMSMAFVPENEACASCRIVHALVKADRKQTRIAAKPLQGTTISHPDFPHPILISRNTITEWTNQPFQYVNRKNIMLLNIQEELNRAKYVGTSDNHKDVPNVVQSHVFETYVRDIKVYIFVREYTWKKDKYVLHSISDAQDFTQHIKKK